MQEISILGVTYTIVYHRVADDSFLEKCDGYCDFTLKKIVIKADNDNEVGDFPWLQRKSLRHEIIHAFLAESGLQSNFQHPNEFGHDETMVDWFAIQFPRILEVFEKLDIVK